MKIAFITEMNFKGKIPGSHENMRTEFAWMNALDANHYPIVEYSLVNNYDHVFVIFPKGIFNLNAVGAKISNNYNPITELLSQPITATLKQNNKKVHYIQEGPNWLFNDYEIVDQFNFYNNLSNCDSIYSHNEYDCKFYQGLFPDKEIKIIPTLLIENLIKDINPQPESKVIIGGNFARWYGGFQSYIVSNELNAEKWTQESHAKRYQENEIDDLNHLPRLNWLQWMKALSTFKYAVHLMPTVAAGTFSLNCAYFGIPCIGNKNVDTQKICHPELSVDVNDVSKARELAKKLNDKDFYTECSNISRENYNKFYNLKEWRKKINL